MDQLRTFVRRLVSDRVSDREGWHRWKKEPGNEEFMAECFAYTREEGMPAITNLVLPFFHPTLPLIGLNYTNVAHVTLHQFENGWTEPLKLTRGMVFDRRGTLVAFPFPKFFNYGEHKDTRRIPEGPFEVMVKEDGHLAIIFEYRGQFVATTRGCFTSGSADIANEMLKPYVERWKRVFPRHLTVLAELIHPETKVILDYAGRKEFILLAAYSKRTFCDLPYDELTKLGGELGLKVVERWIGSSIEELIQVVKNPTFQNREGFVYRNGNVRIKFKFSGYIAKMIQEKLNPRYVMLRLVEGNLEERVGEFELKNAVDAIVAQLMGVKEQGADKKARLHYLYGLVPEDERTSYHKTVCGKFHSWLVNTGQLAAPETKTSRSGDLKSPPKNTSRSGDRTSTTRSRARKSPPKKATSKKS